MIDVHILLMGDERSDLLEQCLNSLKYEPITLHKCDGVPGDIRTARANAISQGTNDYVGWVDPDDFIIPGAYQLLLDNIGDKKFAWCNEEVWHMTPDLSAVTATHIRKRPHHMHIIHRSLINYNLIRNEVPRRTPDRWVEMLTKQGVHVNSVGYVWREYSTSASRILFAPDDEQWHEQRRKHFLQQNTSINKTTN
ncbi:hypothetical protein Xoosp13_298 [Xanthomonas phage Xoo-sp13]|nr:hypothetical protein Xoosp13_298 [Xanthomonas phage Xoo-sp13]